MQEFFSWNKGFLNMIFFMTAFLSTLVICGAWFTLSIFLLLGYICFLIEVIVKPLFIEFLKISIYYFSYYTLKIMLVHKSINTIFAYLAVKIFTQYNFSICRVHIWSLINKILLQTKQSKYYCRHPNPLTSESTDFECIKTILDG